MKERRRRYALLIGNTDYQSQRLPNLSSPKRDVNDLAKILKDPSLGGFYEVNILINKSSNEINNKLGNFYDSKHKDDLLLLYFSGHGVRDKNGSLFLAAPDTIDTDSQLLTTATSSDLIRKLTGNTKSKKQIVIIDSCFSGAFNKGIKSKMPLKISLEDMFVPEKIEEGSGLVVITSSNSVQPSYEGFVVDKNIKNSLFTHFLIEGILTGNADKNKTGLISIKDLYDFAHHKTIKKIKNQTPWIFNKTQGDLIISHAPTDITEHLSRHDFIAKNYKTSIKQIESSIFPILIRLEQISMVNNLKNKISSFFKVFNQKDISSVVLLGLTGVGKTSLLNSILHSNIGASGGGGAQSAASLVIGSNNTKYKVRIKYLGLEDIQKYAEIIKINSGKKDLFKRPDEQGLPESLKAIFNSIGIEDNVVLNKTLDMSNLPEDIAYKIERNVIETEYALNEYDKVINHIKDHTNTRRKYWPITEEVYVSGPFQGVTDNVQLIDLPGLGDLNKLRVEKAKKVLKEANQIIVALNERGFTEDIRQILGETQIISYLLTNPEIPQIIIVGTKLDNINLNDAEIEELGLDIDCKDDEIIEARFLRWKSLVKQQWEEMLTVWSNNTKLSNKNHLQSINNIIFNTKFIPSSPVAYLCLNGLERDRRNRFQELFPQDQDHVNFQNTGIPEIRSGIIDLAKQQKTLKEIVINNHYTNLIKSTINICKPIVDNLSRNVKAKLRNKSKLNKLVDDITTLKFKKIKFKKKEILTTTSEKLIKVESIISEAWKDLDGTAIAKVFTSHLKDANFQTIKAALKRDGVFKSKGKKKTVINVPHEIGVYVVEPLASYIYETILDSFFKDISDDIMFNTEVYFKKIKQLFSSKSLEDDEFNSFKENVYSIFNQFKADIEKEIEIKIPRKNDFDIIELAYSSIGNGFHQNMVAAYSMARGKGAKQRAIDKLISSSKEMLPAIINESAKTFSVSLLEILSDCADDLYDTFQNQKKSLSDETIDITNLTFKNIDVSDKKELSEQLNNALVNLEKMQ